MIRSNDYQTSTQTDTTAGGALQCAFDGLVNTLVGLEEFGHQMFSRTTDTQPRKLERGPEILDPKARELAATMIALEEYGFHIFTGSV